jgi:predicted dehydrogenase
MGAGGLALHTHLPILGRMDGVEVAAIAEPERTKRDAALQQVPDAIALADHREITCRREIQGVVVCLPNALHAEAAVAAFDAGQHVYLEKPIATSLEEGAEVLAAWRRAGTIGMIGFNYRFNRLYRSARRLLETGRLGPLEAACSTFTIAGTDLPAWKRSRATGGGALLDLASHHIDLIRFLFREPVSEVIAKLWSRETEDDTAYIRLRLASDLPVEGLFSLTAANEERFEIYGKDGTLTVDRSLFQDAVISRPGRRAARRRGPMTSIRALAHPRYVLDKRRTPGHEPSHRVALARFVAAIRDGRAATPDLEDGYSSLEVVSMAERSARSGKPERASGV